MIVCVCACVCAYVCVCILKYSGSSLISLNGKVCPLGTPTQAKVKKVNRLVIWTRQLALFNSTEKQVGLKYPQQREGYIHYSCSHLAHIQEFV